MTATHHAHKQRPEFDEDLLHIFSAWVLAHYQAFVSDKHHDPNGFGTVVLVVTGIKLWSIFRARQGKKAKGRKNLEKQHLSLFDGLKNQEVESWFLFPGDVLYVETLLLGGQF